METSAGSPGGFKTAQGDDLEIPDPLGLGPVTTARGHGEFPLGTRRISQVGYITVKTETGWENEARLVLERHLGRPLVDNEEARRKPDTPRWDNRLERLELWRDRRPARMPAAKPRKRTNWKGLYQEAIAVIEDVSDDRNRLGLDGDTLAAVRRVLENRPG